MAERKLLAQIDEEQGSQIPIEQGMPDSYYDTQNMIGAIKDADKMMEFENLQLMIDLQQPKQSRGPQTLQIKEAAGEPVGWTNTVKLVAVMLFLSHSKLSIKLRYILSMYRVDGKELGVRVRVEEDADRAPRGGARCGNREGGRLHIIPVEDNRLQHGRRDRGAS